MNWRKMTNPLPKELRETLAKKHACYVLITCGQPTESGEMQVEMNYEGDAALAAFLIEGAQGAIETLVD